MSNFNILEFPEIHKDTIKCSVCGKYPAKWLCDYETGKIFDAVDENGRKKPIQKVECSMPLCDKCTTKINGKDYCPNHVLDLKWECEQKIKEKNI